MARIALSIVVLAVALAGCPPPPHIVVDAGTPDAGVDDAGPGGLDPSTYCESIVDFFCPFYLRCGRMAVADVDACRPVFLEACNARFEPSFAALVDARLLTLSQDGIDACRAHLENVACDQQILDLDGPCAGMWQGTQPAGAACGFDVESFTCSPGTRCVLDLTFCGTCDRVAADGDDCLTDGVTCGATSDCDANQGVCVARKKVGEACSVDEHCVLGAVCDATDTCAGPSYVGVGDACDFTQRCPYASQCINGTCVATVELGATCDAAAAPCDSGFCRSDAQQPPHETCVDLVAQGDACTVDAECQTGACSQGACSVLPSACFNPAPAP